MSSSPICSLDSTDVPLTRVSLATVLAQVPDPRDPRGVRHPLSRVLVIAQAAVAAGARTLLGISEWAADVDREALTRLGVEAQALEKRTVVRYLLAGNHQQRAQALRLQGLDLLRRPPLRSFQTTARSHGAVVLQAFLQREGQV